ncbi:MAG: hypothetical protein ACK5P5_08245 [Pseudobdellovibrionaceae bacterium]
MDTKAKITNPYCVIIPAAGFGKRMGQPESKEMLPVLGEQGPMIQYALDLFKRENCRIVVPTRREKRNLISFLQENYPKVEILFIENSKEWADTVLQSQGSWQDRNILVLPDTRWDPPKVVFEVLDVLQNHNFAFSSFASEQAETWGVFRIEAISDSWAICDKPPKTPANKDQFSKNLVRGTGLCWGHIAFQKPFGESIFSAILRSHHSRDFEPLHTGICGKSIMMKSFVDLTRPASL